MSLHIYQYKWSISHSNGHSAYDQMTCAYEDSFIYYSGQLTMTPLNILLTFRFRRKKEDRKHLLGNKNKSAQIIEIKHCGKLIRSNEALWSWLANDNSTARTLQKRGCS